MKLVIWLIKAISHLPFWALYILSDIFYCIIRLSGYRKNVVIMNLKNSFPEKNDKEIKRISKAFFHHLADTFVETFKIWSVSDEVMNKHVRMVNTELIEKYYNQDKDIIAALGHYGNWEWIPFCNKHISPQVCSVYHKLENETYDKFMLELRSKWDTLNFTMKTSFRSMIKLKQENKRYIIGMISDQTPARPKIQYYTQFLNQDTPVHTGVAKMAKKTGNPVVFTYLKKTKRGYYDLITEPLIDNPADYTENEITDKFIQRLEKLIIEQPEYWLWSHKRWKHKRNI